MTKDKALKMAIEAMERAEEVDWELNSLHVLNILQAITACKEALLVPTNTEQPAQEIVRKVFDIDNFHSSVLDRIKLEQPAQEPVAWMHRHAGEITEFNDFQSCQYCEPLYTHPAPQPALPDFCQNISLNKCKYKNSCKHCTHPTPSWQGLSDDELSKLFANLSGANLRELGFYRHARMLEQTLKEKNTCS